MSRIAEAVGISGPALYKHFGGRTEILEAAMDLLQTRVTPGWTRPRILTPSSVCGSWGQAHLHHRGRLRGRRRASVRVRRGLDPAPDLKEQMGRRQRETLQRFIDILEDGQRQGSVRRDIDTLVVAWSLMGLTWMENVAMLEGVDEFITDGISAQDARGDSQRTMLDAT